MVQVIAAEHCYWKSLQLSFPVVFVTKRLVMTPSAQEGGATLNVSTLSILNNTQMAMEEDEELTAE